MTTFNELLNINHDTYGAIKIIVAVIGFLSLIFKLKEGFSDKHRKQNLKTDLEILKASKNIASLKTEQIQKRIEFEIDYLYDEKKHNSENIFQSILGAILLVVFSLWTVDIFQNSEGFNPWVICTMFCAGMGLNIFLDDNNKKKTTGEFFRIEFHDSENFWFAFIIGVIASISFLSLIFTYKSFTWGAFFAFLFVLLGLRALTNNLKFKRIKS